MNDAAVLCRRYVDYLDRPADVVAKELESFAALLLNWNRARNLVSRETVNLLWPRHIADSLQLVTYVRQAEHTVLDLGSGGGFPAIPLAIARRGLSVTLVESNSGKVAFLRAASRELGLNLTVLDERIERCGAALDGPPHLITARALAPLPSLLRLVALHAGPTTRMLLPKGRDYGEELAEATALWQFDVIVHASDSSGDGVILELTNLAARSVPHQ